ncbi:hypothetical protein LX36DRAFT_661750 [Colletotrichum falcatum]|nr:hypothetical protein LX36DRAFT_661750 [Colletotrichum falcatum]
MRRDDGDGEIIVIPVTGPPALRPREPQSQAACQQICDGGCSSVGQGSGIITKCDGKAVECKCNPAKLKIRRDDAGGSIMVIPPEYTGPPALTPRQDTCAAECSTYCQGFGKGVEQACANGIEGCICTPGARKMRRTGTKSYNNISPVRRVAAPDPAVSIDADKCLTQCQATKCLGKGVASAQCDVNNDPVTCTCK